MSTAGPGAQRRPLPRRGRGRRLALAAAIGLGGLALGGLALGVMAWRAALSAPALERALLELPRNAKVAAHGLTRRALHLGIAGLPDPATVTWLHAPAPFEGAPVVVLLHGTPSSLFSWGGLVLGEGGLATRAEVYALELLDHGLGPYAEGPASFQRCADFVGAVVRALDLPPATLLGQSYGGEVAWRAALDHPDLFSHLVLMDSSGLPRPDEGWLPEEVAMRELPGAGLGWVLNSPARVATALAPHVRAPLDEGLRDEVFLLCSRPAAWSAMVDLVRDENGARAPELRHLEQPTLLLWGADDLAYPPARVGQAFERAIPDARLITLEGCGHYPHEDDPAAVARELMSFLSEG